MKTFFLLIILTLTIFIVNAKRQIAYTYNKYNEIMLWCISYDTITERPHYFIVKQFVGKDGFDNDINIIWMETEYGYQIPQNELSFDIKESFNLNDTIYIKYFD